MYLVVGNIFALLASLLMVYSGLLHDKKKIIVIQIIQILLFVISNLVLGGIAGAIVNAISIIRNYLYYKNKLGTKEKVLITILSVLFTILFNNKGLIGLLPLIASVVYLWYMEIKQIICFKNMIIFTVILWFVYDIFIKSYTSAIFDFLTIVTNTVSIISIYTAKRKNNNYHQK